MWHAGELAQVKKVGVCVYVRAEASAMSPRQSQVKAPSLGLTPHRLNCWRGGPLGRKTRFLAFPIETWGSLFSININVETPECKLPLEWPEDESEGRGSVADWGWASASGQSLPILGEKHQKFEGGGKKKNFAQWHQNWGKNYFLKHLRS